jgi:hypothetical protein
MSDLRCITELVHDTLMKGYEQESSLGAVAPCAHFNLDFYHYLLVQVWDYFDGDDNPNWHYSLWYFNGEGVKLCDFPASGKTGLRGLRRRQLLANTPKRT